MIFVRKWLLALTLLAVAGCSGGGNSFSNPTKTVATLNGTAVIDRQGAADPVARAFAILIDRNQVRQVARTNEQGEFVFANVTPGDLTMILNDLNGYGALRRMVVIGGGDNDVGSFTLSALEKQPEVFDFRNIGYEEKITQSTGDHEDAVFSGDTSFGLAWVRLPGEYVFDLVRTDLMTGAEETLVVEQNIGEPEYWFGDKLSLVGDRFALYGAYRPDDVVPDSNSMHIIAFDLEHRQSTLVPNNSASGTYHPTPEVWANQTFVWCYTWSHADAKLYYLQQIGETVELSRHSPDGSYCILCGQKMEFCSFDLVSSQRICTALHSSDDYTTFDSFAFTTDSVVFQVAASSESEWGGSVVHTGGPLSQIRFADMRREQLMSETVFDYSPSKDGTRLYFTTPGYAGSLSYSSLNELDLGRRATRTIYTAPVDKYSFVNVTSSPDDRYLAVMKAFPSSSYPSPDGMVVNTATGKVAVEFDGKGTYRGQPLENFTFCSYYWPPGPAPISYAPHCWSQDGKELFLWKDLYEDEYEKLFGERKSVLLILHIPVDGTAPFVEEFEWDTNPHYFPEGDTFRSPDGTLEAQSIRVKESGFSQIFARPVGATEWTQVSFITAQHGQPVWSADGRHLLYLTRDPVSGYNQYFRVVPGSILKPDENLIR